MTHNSMTLKFSVFGAGNLGSQLIAALENKGYTLKYVYGKTKNPRYNHAVENDIQRIVQQSDVIFISVQESKIRSIADQIAASSEPAGKFFFHTSNSLTSDELISLKDKGGIIASFSPLQTFAGTEPADAGRFLDGVFFLSEGDDNGVQLAAAMAGRLNAHMVPVKKEDKVFLHIAGVAASNFLIGVFKLAERQLEKVTRNNADRPGSRPVTIDILIPLIKQTLRNVEQKGVDASLTGPVKRGETAIIDKHLSVLDGPEAQLYRVMSDFLKQ